MAMSVDTVVAGKEASKVMTDEVPANPSRVQGINRADDFLVDAPGLPASELKELPTPSLFPPIDGPFAKTDGENLRAKAVGVFCFEAQMWDLGLHKREVNIALASGASPPEYAGRFRDGVIDLYSKDGEMQSVLQDAERLYRSRPNNDVYLPAGQKRCADPRVVAASQMVVIRDYTCNMNVDPALVEHAVKAAINTYPAKFYKFVASFISATMGPNMHKWLMSVMYQRVRSAEDPNVAALVNMHSWKLLCLLGRPFGPDGTHTDITAPGVEVDVSNDTFAQRCPYFSLEQCLQDYARTYEHLAAKCKGFATSPADAAIMMEVCEIWGKEWCNDVLLVDKKTNRPDYDRVEMHIPMNLNVGVGNRMEKISDWDETWHASKIPSCNPSLTSNLEVNMQDIEEVAHVPAIAVPVGRWMGTVPLDMDSVIERKAALSSESVPAAITEQTLAAAGGYRWGFGHSAFTFVRLASGKLSNYFTPYVVRDGERTPVKTFALRVAVCRDWGADVFNDPETWELDTANPSMPSGPAQQSPAPDMDDNVHLLPTSGANGSTAAEPVYQSVRQDTIRLQNVRSSLQVTGSVFSTTNTSQKVKLYERPTSVCAVARPLMIDHLPPYGPCTFRHNVTPIALNYPNDKIPFEGFADLERCITTDASRTVMYVTSYLLYRTQENTSLSPLRPPPKVVLPPQVADSDVQLRLNKMWNLNSNSDGIIAMTDTVEPGIDIPIATSPFGTDKDAMLALNLTKLIVQRGIGMHLSHFLFTDMCSGDSAAPSAKVRDYLPTWYEDTSAFVDKFALLLKMYTQSRPGYSQPVLSEASMYPIHLLNRGRSDNSLRKYITENFKAALPLFMPRCLPLSHPRELASSGKPSREAYVEAARLVSTFFAIEPGKVEDFVYMSCDATFGMEWLSLYVHRAGVEVDAQRVHSWPNEYAVLREEFPRNSFVRVLSSEKTTTSFAAHTMQVFPTDTVESRDKLMQEANTITAAQRNANHCNAYRVTPTEAGADTYNLQAVVDTRKVVDGTIYEIDELPEVVREPTFVRIPVTFKGDISATGLSPVGRGVVITYAAWRMADLLSKNAVLSRQSASFVNDIVGMVDATKVGTVLGVGQTAMTKPDGITWEAEKRSSAIDIMNKYAPWLTFTHIRHLGLNPQFQRFRVDDTYLFDKQYGTSSILDDSTGEADATLPRVDGYKIEDIWSVQDESHGKPWEDADAFAKFLGRKASARLEELAVHTFNAHDYSAQLQTVVHEAYNRYGTNLFDATAFGGALCDEVVNDHPLAVRLLVELDTTLGVAAAASAEERLTKVVKNPFFRIIDGLTKGKLFEKCNMHSKNVPVAAKFEATYTGAAAARYRKATSGFYMEDTNGLMFAESASLKPADTSGTYEASSPDVVHLVSDVTKDRIHQDHDTPLQLNNPNITNGCLFFSMVVMGSMLYHMRKHYNESDAIRCVPRSESGRQPDSQHHSLLYLYESCLCSREQHTGSATWDVSVGRKEAWPSALLGGMSSKTFRTEYGSRGAEIKGMRDTIERVRRLSTPWATVGPDTTAKKGHATWVPLPLAEAHTLFKILGLFDFANGIPVNPWANTKGALRSVFRCSKHNAYIRTDSEQSFANWQSVIPYATPSRAWRPSSLYGGDLVMADFTKHRMESMSKTLENTNKERTYNSLRRARYGVTDELNLFAKTPGDLECISHVSHIPDKAEPGSFRMVSHFSAYARNLVLFGLSSHVPSVGDPMPSDARTSLSYAKFLSNWFRIYLNNGRSVNVNDPGTDDVPVIMGYYPHNGRAVAVASTLLCMYNKTNALLAIPSTHRLIPPENAAIFGHVAAVLDAFATREERRKEAEKAYKEIQEKYPDEFQGTEGELKFYKKFNALQGERAEFFSKGYVSMLVKAGLTPKTLPLGALHVKSLDPEDVMQSDEGLKDIRTAVGIMHDGSLANGTGHLVGNQYLTRDAMSIRDMIPPEHAHCTALLAIDYKTHKPSNVVGHDDTHQQAVEELSKETWTAFATEMVDKALGVQKVQPIVVSPAVPTPKRQLNEPLKAVSEQSGKPRSSSVLERSMTHSALLSTPQMTKYRQKLHEVHNERVTRAVEKLLAFSAKSVADGTPLSFEALTNKLVRRAEAHKGSAYGLQDQEIRDVVKKVFGEDWTKDPTAP